MRKTPHRHPSAPAFDDAFLDRIAVAFGRRAKAIKHVTHRFACTREIEAGDVERLNVDVATLEQRPTQIRLSAWPGGAVWLGVHQPAATSEGGWAFAYTARGNVADLEAADVVRNFEATKSQAYGSGRRPDAPDRIERIWQGAALERQP